MMAMMINDLSARIVACREDIDAAVADVLQSGWVVLGPHVDRFEKAFAAYLDAPWCVGVANGTDAIELGLRALGVAAGDRVATVANAGMYTATALRAIGAEPYFLDVDPDTRNTTLDEVTRAVGQRVKAVVVTHLYGQAVSRIADMAALCADARVMLFEDCAQAHGAKIAGRRVGTFGQAASFSFYPTKNLGALGDGGAVVTADEATAKRVRWLRQYGWTQKYTVTVAGARNSRLDELQAAILLRFLPRLDSHNAARREIARAYDARIRHAGVILPPVGGEDFVAHLYTVRCPQSRASLQAHLRALEIGTDVHYPVPDHRQPVFADRFAGLELPQTQRLAQEILTLPCYPEMTAAQVETVIAGVNSWRP